MLLVLGPWDQPWIVANCLLPAAGMRSFLADEELTALREAVR
jgi:hypothetical protein